VSPDSLASGIDDLYRRAVEHPTEVDETVLIEWAETAAETSGHDRDQAKVVRRAIRTARKLVRYWTEHDPSVLPDWHNGVDEALGSQGWRAQLDTLRFSLEKTPDPEVFDLVKERHRIVHFTEWMEGVGYEEWLEGR
jgi:hypothetical protein